MTTVLLFLLIPLILHNSGVHAETPNTIRTDGVVRAQNDGNPIPNARVLVYQKQTYRRWRTEWVRLTTRDTDDNGVFNLDLQKLVHEDMKMNFSNYPQKWGLMYPDKNIDHRRVPNPRTFFNRLGWYLDITDRAKDYRPGDMVTCIVPPQLPHIMIVSDKKNSNGIPFILHNIGAGVQEEDRLFEFEITGHYRVISTRR